MAAQQHRNAIGLIFGGAIAGSLLVIPSSIAQQALPPPPSVPNLVPLPSLQPVNPMPGMMGAPQEAIFQAPAQAQSTAPSYQVLVNGDSPYLLQQIQRVDAASFVREYQGKRVVQAGVFSTAPEAQQRVAVLNQQGIGAQVVTATVGFPSQVMPTTYPNAYPNSAMGMNPNAMNADLPRVPFYQVVVPTPPSNYGMITNKMMTMGVRPEAIQTKRSPNGPHVAVGPFTQQGEAESVSSYLRSGGMDARVFYSR
ncbi:hypothetical protein JOY44_00550 [Phormidium sp. CLA17]|uniref:hypothetical protein n=1 Tax=Leptolyngbya sp. Cla-17 TaxID=2803751 RepID=UPI00149256FF|nr:hypothetical protein [Leptolyngbya sp. Cla-17]MBM0740145.1 hypothetical protein [Leptolyngbya sp. Cla-17]